jgi:hypothetical protein
MNDRFFAGKESYEAGCAVESRGEKFLEDVLPLHFEKFWYDHTKDYDMRVVKDGKEYTVELKVEVKNPYGNLFLETWSNKKRMNPGWFYKSHADLLLYVFLESKEVYLVSMNDLRGWAYAADWESRWKEKKQGKYQQMNDTWGRPVPIRVLLQDASLTRLSLS